MSSQPQDLEGLRSSLTTVDGRILELIAERQRIVGDIGRLKQATDLPTRDYEREREVLETARSQAKDLGVDPDLADIVVRALIRSSLTSQERRRVVSERRGDGRRVLIIGGAGKMGRWFVEFFASQGFKTCVADPLAEPGPGRLNDWRDAGLDFDVICVATPLAVTNQILQELARHRPEGLVFDIGSLKTPLRDGLRALAEEGCRVTSLHPMFGPDTKLLSGRHLVFVDVGHARATAEARELFAATMVEELEMGLDEHDRLIAFVLGLSHALNIAFFTALAESGEMAPALRRISSTTFDAQLGVATAVAEENPRLYFEIQHWNHFGLRSLDALCESAFRLRELVATGDEPGFVRMMERGREYLASRPSRPGPSRTGTSRRSAFDGRTL